MAIKGIDISNNNDSTGSIDWGKVRKDDVRFVFFKVNEGDYIDKTTSKARVSAARDAGLLVGGYDFIRPKNGRTGAQEFDIFWDRCKHIGLGKVGDLRPVVDVEATAVGRDATRAYVKSWVDRCYKVTGHKPIIYTGHFWRETLGNWNTTLGCKLWLAAYVAKDKYRLYVPTAWKRTASFWQYTEHGSVAGVPSKGRTDINLYQSTLANLKSGHTIKPRKK